MLHVAHEPNRPGRLDLSEANRLKKVFPDEQQVATTVEEEFTLDKGRSEDKLPVVTATKNTGNTFLPCWTGPRSY